MSYAITGIKPIEPANIPLRRDITELQANKDLALQFSLFIQALAVFQKQDVTDKLGYFQIAGIHGEPDVEWDGVPKPPIDPETGSGYCAHNKVTFPTWHRPYMLLFEQRLWEIMIDLINASGMESQDKVIWTDAANNWRLPYWNWGLKQQWIQDFGLPEIMSQESVSILNFKNISSTVPNPLYKFENPMKDSQGLPIPFGDPLMKANAIPADGKLHLPWDECCVTSRYGITTQPPSQWKYGVQNWQDANVELATPSWYGGDLGTLGEAVYRLMSYNFTSWEAFASTRYHEEVKGSDFLSLEYVHNNIHNFAGGVNMSLDAGVGQMANVPVAGFDPIFWLHHCYIDKLIAMWQVINPTQWFNKPLPGDPSPADPLDPFHYDKNYNMYNSNMTRDWRTLGYSYDDLVPTNVSSPGDEPLGPIPRQGEDLAGRERKLADLKRGLNQNLGATRKALLGAPRLAGADKDYVINIIYDRYALGGSPYIIHFFLGPIPAAVQPRQYSTHPSHVGSMYTFTRNVENDPRCDNCTKQKEAGVLSKAQVPLTLQLFSRAVDNTVPDIKSLNPAEVQKYLQDNLHWKVVKVPGLQVPINQLPKTKIFVMKATAEHSADETKLSRFHSFEPMWEVCSGKLGGAQPGEQLVRH